MSISEGTKVPEFSQETPSITSADVLADVHQMMASRRVESRQNLQAALDEVPTLTDRQKAGNRYQAKVQAMELAERSGYSGPLPDFVVRRMYRRVDY